MGELFSTIGMCIYLSKSSVINIRNGELSAENVTLSHGSTMLYVKLNEAIKYLGVRFTDSIVYVKKLFLINLEEVIRNLKTTPPLRGFQIDNEYFKSIRLSEAYIFKQHQWIS